MASEFPDIMGMGDVVRYLKVSRQYIDRVVAAGKLRSRQTSTGKVFLRSDVTAFQQERVFKRQAPKKRPLKKRKV